MNMGESVGINSERNNIIVSHDQNPTLHVVRNSSLSSINTEPQANHTPQRAVIPNASRANQGGTRWTQVVQTMQQCGGNSSLLLTNSDTSVALSHKRRQTDVGDSQNMDLSTTVHFLYWQVLAVRPAESNEYFKFEMSRPGSLVGNSFAKGPNSGS